MIFGSLTHIRHLCFATLIAGGLSGEGLCLTTSIEIGKPSIIATSGNSISFRATASNARPYEVRLSCFKQEFNYREGSLRVLKTPSHVGASASFPYEECLDMRRSILKGEEALELSWNQEKFEDFISAKLDFRRIDEPSSSEE